MRQCKWNWSCMSNISRYQLKKSSSELLCSLYVKFKPRKCVRYGPSAVLCVPGLSLCSQSFVCLMTSLRGLLALDSKSQNEELPYSHVFKGAPSRYMTGNFCHDPLIINIKIDTKDEVQNYVRLLPDYCCPHRAGVACWKSYSCQNPSLLALDEEKWAAGQKSCTPCYQYV